MVVGCRVHRFADGLNGGTVYQSGLSFTNPTSEALQALRELMETAIARSMAEQVANLRGLGPVSERKMPVFGSSGMVTAEGVDQSQATEQRIPIARAHSGYVRCTLRDRGWDKRWTRDPQPPEEGFTVLATEARDQIDILCEDYRRMDGETRQLIRLLARITSRTRSECGPPPSRRLTHTRLACASAGGTPARQPARTPAVP